MATKRKNRATIRLKFEDLRSKIQTGIDQAERREFGTLTMSEIKAQALRNAVCKREDPRDDGPRKE